MSMPSNTGVLSTLQSILTFTNIQVKVKSSFRNHDKVTDRRTESFLTIILNELLAVREAEQGFRALLCILPPVRLWERQNWELDTSVLFHLRSSTSLPAEKKNQ